MRLECELTLVNEVVFGSAAGLRERRLSIEREELCRLLAADSRLRSLDIHLANPGEECRIVDVFDVFEPRCKLPNGANFPGVVDPLARVGDGRTRVLRGAAVVVLNGLPDRFGTVIDMAGKGAELIPYSRTANICISSKPAPGVERAAYYRALKVAAAKASAFLAKAAAAASADATEVYDLGATAALLSPRSGVQPRIAYVAMLASQQVPTEPDEPVLYGDNVRYLLPTVLHPNELLDGAMIAPYWNFGTETYFIQNHPMVLELYRRHGKGLDFAGVVATVAGVTEAERRRSALMAANLVKDALGADGALLTKVGGGISESALMSTLEACEDLGVRCTIVVWTHGGDRRIEGSLTFMSPRADSVVSAGIYDEPVELPPMARVIGGPMLGPLIVEQGTEPRAAAGPLSLRYAHLAGVINQLGAGTMSIEEY